MSSTLEDALLHRDPSIRTVAVRFAYRMWEQNRETGFGVLDSAASAAVRHRVPDAIAFESALGLSLLIFFDHADDPLVLARLQTVWRRIIGSLLGIRESSGRFQQAIRAFIRERIFAGAIGAAFRILQGFPDYNIISYSNLEAFFRLDPVDKGLFRQMTNYLEVGEQYSEEEMKANLIAALRIRKDVLFAPLWGLISQRTLYGIPMAIFPFLRMYSLGWSRIPNLTRGLAWYLTFCPACSIAIQQMTQSLNSSSPQCR